MSSKALSDNKLNGLRRIVQQLRQEARIERMKISKASADIVKYCSQHEKSDPLIAGIPASENPFKEKKPCTLL